MEKHLFLGCMTHQGFFSYYDKVIDAYDLKKLYILKGGSGVGKSTFMKKFGAAFTGENIDYLHCSADKDSLDGIILPDKRIGIIDGTAPHIIDVKYPGVIDETVNLGEYIIWENVGATKESIDKINAAKKQHYQNIQN
jgi:predicted ABC-type ATPase